ncbi:hypothetical protein Tco_1259023, partial [Tanacetum coccineum]
GVDGGCEVDGCVWGDKDGEDVILEGDDSVVVSMVGNSGMSTPEYPLEALFHITEQFLCKGKSRKGSLIREKHSLAFVQKDLNEFGIHQKL